MKLNLLAILTVFLIGITACTSNQEKYITYEWYPVKYDAKDGTSFRNYRYKYVNTLGQEMVIDGLKEASFFTVDGLSRVQFKGQNEYGYLNTKGELAIPTRYQEATLFSEGLAWAKKVDSNMNDPVEVINIKGETVFTLSVRKVRRFKEGLCAFSDGDKWGYVNNKGEVVIAAQYDEAKDFANGLAAIKTENGWGYIDQKGDIVIEPQYSVADDFNANGQAVVEKRNGRSLMGECSVIKKNNDMVIPTGRYNRIYNDGNLFRCSHNMDQLNWCDESGKELFEKSVSCTWEGVQLAQFNDGDKVWTGTCFVNRNGEVDNELTAKGRNYDSVSPFNNGFAMVKSKKGYYGVINEKGEEVVEAQYYQFGFGAQGNYKAITIFF